MLRLHTYNQIYWILLFIYLFTSLLLLLTQKKNEKQRYNFNGSFSNQQIHSFLFIKMTKTMATGYLFDNIRIFIYSFSSFFFSFSPLSRLFHGVRSLFSKFLVILFLILFDDEISNLATTKKKRCVYD